MASFNKVVLVGNFCRNVELKYLQSGMAVAEMSVAVNDKRKNAAGEWVEDVTFVDVTMWGKTAEIANQYLSKGSQVLIEGRLKLDQWEKDGQKRSKLRVVCERLVMLGSKGAGKQDSSSGGSPAPDQSEAQAPASSYDESNLPF